MTTDEPEKVPGRPRRPYLAVEPDLLTDEEIRTLRQEAKETSAYFKKAFADLRSKAKRKQRS